MAKTNTGTAATPTPTRRRTRTAPAVAANSRHGGNSGGDVVLSAQEIAEAAYHRYLNRGGHDGGDFDDWLEAERELRSRSRPKSQ